jgi:hypothetical protein
MSFKVKDLAMNVGGSIDEASTCSTWTRQTSGGASGASCSISLFLRDGTGGRNLSTLRAQLRQVMTRA